MDGWQMKGSHPPGRLIPADEWLYLSFLPLFYPLPPLIPFISFSLITLSLLTPPRRTPSFSPSPEEDENSSVSLCQETQVENGFSQPTETQRFHLRNKHKLTISPSISLQMVASGFKVKQRTSHTLELHAYRQQS